MSEKLVFDFKNWFLSMGIQDKNISIDQIEEEFKKLSPPEMRDIWRNIVVLVKPANEVRYIKKVLLLNELKKQHANNQTNPPLLSTLQKSLNSVQEYERFKNHDKMIKKLINCYNSIVKVTDKVNKMRLQVMEKDSKRKKLLEKNEKLINLQTLITLKIAHQENIVKDLSELYNCLAFINSFWLKSDITDEDQLVESMKNCFKVVSDYSSRRNTLSDSELKEEKKKLIDEVETLTLNIPVSNLYKSVINMLRETLSTLLKLSDHINAKQGIEKVQFESKLIVLKKQCVELFLENQQYRKRIENLRENVKKQQSELHLLLIKDLNCTHHKDNSEIWLDSECLKHRLTIKENFLYREEELIKKKKKLPHSVDFSTINNEEFLKSINDYVSQLSQLELEITNNLYYLSDDPINTFINCQSYMRTNVERFVNEIDAHNFSKFDADLLNSLKRETELLWELDVRTIANSGSVLKSGNNENDVISASYIMECTEMCSFIIYLINARDNFFQKTDKLSVKAELVENKKIKIKDEEEKCLTILETSLKQGKNNLADSKKYANECLKNLTLWIESSVNEIIPETMQESGYNFAEWLSKYTSIIQYLRKQQRELDKLRE